MGEEIESANPKKEAITNLVICEVAHGDSTGGDSGAPYWIDVDDQKKLIAVHRASGYYEQWDMRMEMNEAGKKLVLGTNAMKGLDGYGEWV